MNMNFLLVPAFLISSMLLGCEKKLDPNDPTSVREFLEGQKIAMTPGQYVAFSTKGDTANMSLLTKVGIGPNSTDARGNTALAIAANKGNAMMVTYLLAAGADMAVKNSKGMFPIEDAVSLGHKDVVAAMIESEKKRDPSLMNLGGAVNMAARQGFAEVAQLLGDAGAPLDARSSEGYTPLHWAVKNGHLPVVEYLISKKVDLNAVCGQGYSPLDWAVNENYSKVIAALKKAGAKHTAAYLKVK
jgi:ankyrin repeat protein